MMSLGVNTAKVRGNHLTTDKTIQRESKLDVIADMLLTLCGRNTEISFSETKEFERRLNSLEEK